MHRSQSVQAVLQEVDRFVEAVVEAEAPPEVRQEVEEDSVIEVLGEEEEEEASVLGEGVEEVILISRGLALVGEDHSLIWPGVTAKGVLCMGKYPKEVRSVQHLQLNRLGDSLGSIELRSA